MIEVVAALIWDNDKFMICQRPANKARALLWEFVGGKVEQGETKEQALIRECQEELAITLSVGDVFMDVIHEYPDITVHLTLFNANIAEGVPQKLEHNDIKWIKVSEIDNYDFCPADTGILEKLRLEESLFKDFDPTNSDFTFNFTKDTCSELRTGICELDEIDITHNRKLEDSQLRHLSRCQRIYYGLLDKKIKTMPQIMKCKCRHYICIDGQHRICVAQKMKLRLGVFLLGDVDENCEKCTPVQAKEDVVELVIECRNLTLSKNDTTEEHYD